MQRMSDATKSFEELVQIREMIHATERAKIRKLSKNAYEELEELLLEQQQQHCQQQCDEMNYIVET